MINNNTVSTGLILLTPTVATKGFLVCPPRKQLMFFGLSTFGKQCFLFVHPMETHRRTRFVISLTYRINKIENFVFIIIFVFFSETFDKFAREQ